MLLYFVNCILAAFGPPFIVYKLFLSNSSSFSAILVGFGGYTASQLAKMLFMATFLPEAVDGGWLFEIFRNVVNGADVAFVFFIFRWAKLDPRSKVTAVAIGWTFGDNVFGRLAPFFGALGVEFDWTYFCQALDSNVSMIATLLFVYFVDSWAQLRRRRDGSENAQKYLFSALMLCVGLPLFLSYFAHVLGEWYALLLKAVVVSGVAYVVKEQGI